MQSRKDHDTLAPAAGVCAEKMPRARAWYRYTISARSCSASYGKQMCVCRACEGERHGSSSRLVAHGDAGGQGGRSPRVLGEPAWSPGVASSEAQR